MNASLSIRHFVMKIIIIALFAGMVISCTAPIRDYLQPEPGSSDTSNVISSTPQRSEAAAVASGRETGPGRVPINPPFLAGPSRWPGNYFIILPKQKLVGSFGYNLFSCINEGCATLSSNPAWEHENRRIRTEAIAGDTVMATAAEPFDNEWVVTFRHGKTQRLIYAMTHKQAIAEVFPADDLLKARKRWLNTFIFSKRGVISVQSTNSESALSSHRVRIQDSLLVTEVTSGMTPLPVKPIWLHVTTPDGVNGFIPVRYSWTNTMNSFDKNVSPWDEDILETNPLQLFAWNENSWDLINNHRVVADMIPAQVRLSWGSPESERKGTGNEANRIQWNYPSHTVVFMDGKVVDIIPAAPESR